MTYAHFFISINCRQLKMEKVKPINEKVLILSTEDGEVMNLKATVC